MEGIVGGRPIVNEIMGGSGEIAGIEVAHRLQTFVAGVGIPFSRSGPCLLGWSAIMNPGFGKRELQRSRRHSAAAIVMAVGWPDFGVAKGAKYEKRKS